MVLVTARALPSTDMPSESTVGGFASLITTARPAWPLTAPLATLILPPSLTQVTELRSRPARSLPSTLTSVLPPVLTCEAGPAAGAGPGPPLLSEQPTSTAAPAISVIAPATTRFIDLSLRSNVAPMAPVVWQVKSGRIATDPKLCRDPQVRFAGDAVIHGCRTTGAAGAAAFPGWASGFDRRRGGRSRRAARHRPGPPVSVAVGAPARLRRRRSGRGPLRAPHAGQTPRDAPHA